MSNRLVIGCASALMVVAGCNGGEPPGDGGTGIDAHVPTVDANIPPGVDGNLPDAFVPGVDAFTPPDAFTPGIDGGMDAGMTTGCELGNTYPTLDFQMLHAFGDLPVSMALAPGRNEVFVVLRGGQIVIMNPTTGAVGGTAFLDISSRIHPTPNGMAEFGLLGLAFHPDYVRNGLLYIAYTTQAGAAFEDRVAVANRATPDTATFGSDIFVIPDPANNHNGGQLGFGPDDGFLYYGVGDGGEQGDPSHRAQNTSLALGKIHRFQVGPGIATYTPAPGNPFITSGGLATIWGYGVRNPWRFSWDRLTHDMYIGDVGQNLWEEVDFLPAGSPPPNLGWSVCEGTHDFNGSCASLTGDVLPIAEYPHTGGLMAGGGGGSITGGYVYRGAAIPALRGAYVFADEISSHYAALRSCPGMPVTPIALAGLNGPSGSTCQNPATFGEDRNGELLVSCLGDLTIYRIIAP